MAMRLSKSWRRERMAEIEEHLVGVEQPGGTPLPINLVLSLPVTKKWMVIQLTNAGIPFKMINLGAGVVRITTNTEVCPKCGGTGRC